MMRRRARRYDGYEWGRLFRAALNGSANSLLPKDRLSVMAAHLVEEAAAVADAGLKTLHEREALQESPNTAERGFATDEPGSAALAAALAKLDAARGQIRHLETCFKTALLERDEACAERDAFERRINELNEVCKALKAERDALQEKLESVSEERARWIAWFVEQADLSRGL